MIVWQMNIVFDPTADDEELFLQTQIASSTLLAFFALNAQDPFARTLLYHELPEHYVLVDAMA